LLIQKGPAAEITGGLSGQYQGKGFLAVPFCREDHPAFFLVPDLEFHDKLSVPEIEMLKTLLPFHESETGISSPVETSKEEYLRTVSNTIAQIRNGDFKKAVLSRIKTIPGNYYSRLPELFESLCKSNPDAFVYLFRIQGQCWIGASPEPFLCSEQDTLKTVSLAGTRPYSKKNMDLEQWNHKELEEQQYVTKHIEDTLQHFRIDRFIKKGPYVARAGNIMHLRTDFSFSSGALGSDFSQFTGALHPTPAVCGMPVSETLQFIRKTENHRREYYSGFLGPVGLHGAMQLYVNLRCLKVYSDRLVLYTGGGITEHSDPLEEWEETEIKAGTLLSVIKPVI